MYFYISNIIVIISILLIIIIMTIYMRIIRCTRCINCYLLFINSRNLIYQRYLRLIRNKSHTKEGDAKNIVQALPKM